MADEPDFEELTWGELKKKLQNEPELAEHPSVKKFFKSLENLIPKFTVLLPERRFPLGEGIGKSFERLLQRVDTALPEVGASTSSNAVAFRIPAAPDPGDVARIRAQVMEKAIAREVEPLRARIQELTAELRRRAGPAIRKKENVSGGISMDPSKSTRLDALLSQVVGSKRRAGHPTRRREVGRLLIERWANQTMATSLAREARELEQALRERYKGGTEDGQPKIPKAKAIENIIRKRYARLPLIYNAVKYFKGLRPI